MFFNYSIFASVILCAVLFYVGQKLSKAVNKKLLRIILCLVFAFLCIPSFLFAAYYLHILKEPIWYIEFRAISNIEVLSSCVGLFFGFISCRDKRVWRFNPKALEIFIFIICMLIILIPYVKPMLLPVEKNAEFLNRWKDGVCLQSTGSTCGPSSLTTIFKYYGISKNEKDVARASFSSATGTENWYLIRYARKNGLKVEILNKNSIIDVPVPSIIGTYIYGRIGHFVTVLGKEGECFVIGDPLKGRLLLTESEFNKGYTFSKFVMHVEKIGD